MPGSATPEKTITCGELTEELQSGKEPDNPGKTAYTIQEGLFLSKRDRENMTVNDLRYDILTIKTGVIGNEYVKTKGYINQSNTASREGHVELHEIMEGEAHYLLQKIEGREVTDALLIEANRNDKIVIPPGYGVVIINPAKKNLRISRIVSLNASPRNEPYLANRGGIYYELDSGFSENALYDKIPPLRHVKAGNIPELGLARREEIYSLVRKEIDRLKFINHPREHEWIYRLYV